MSSLRYTTANVAAASLGLSGMAQRWLIRQGNMGNEMLKPVVLAGGVGSRLWPLSREAYPKQFQKLTGGDSLLAEHLPRLPDLRSPVLARRPDGRLYGVILRGGFRMPAYGDALSEDEHWAVVHHLRTLGGGNGP